MNGFSGGAGVQGLSQTILWWFPPQLQDCHHGCSLPSGQPFHVSFSWTVPRDKKNTIIAGKTIAHCHQANLSTWVFHGQCRAIKKNTISRGRRLLTAIRPTFPVFHGQCRAIKKITQISRGRRLLTAIRPTFPREFLRTVVAWFFKNTNITGKTIAHCHQANLSTWVSTDSCRMIF